MKKETGFQFWGDLVTAIFAVVGVILGMVTWFKVYRVNEAISGLPKLAIGFVASGLVGGIVGFVLGVLLEDSIDNL